MNIHIKRGLVFFLTLVIFMSMFTGIVNALDLNKAYEVSWDHTLTDYDGNTFTWYGGIAADSNDFGHIFASGKHTIHDYTVKRQGLTGSSSTWTYDDDYIFAYCLEPGVLLPNYTEYTGSSDPSHGDKWKRLSESQKDLIMLALSYGYPNRWVGTSKDASACYAATQLIIHQISLNWRTSPTSLNDRSYAMSGYSGTMTEQLTSNKYLKEYYDAILNDMSRHGIRPSFTGTMLNSPTYEMTQSSGQWVVTLTDTNNVLQDYSVSVSSGLNATINGNTLTIRSNTPITSETRITLTRDMPSTNMTTGFLVWSVPGKESANQDMVTGVSNDPLPAYLKLKASTGTLAILKTTQYNGGSVSGFTFEVRNSNNTLVGTYKTDSSGKITIPGLVAGTYSVKEINLSSDYVTPTPNPKSVTVNAGQTASVSFDNVKKRGILTVHKSDADFTKGGYSLAGAEFEVTDSGGNIVDIIVTQADGTGRSKILPLGVYRVKEIKAPYGYQLDPDSYTVTISGTQGTSDIVYAPDIFIAEQPTVGRINLVKSNKTPSMGNYELVGARYEIRAAEDIKGIDGIYYARKGDLMDTLTTDSQGKAQSCDLHLGSYTVQEVSAPHGYVLDSNKYEVMLEYAGQTIPIVYQTVNSGEEPAHGVIRVNKYNQSPDIGDYQLNGAVFEVRAAQDIKQLNGTVIYNKGDLADTITTNSEGEAQTKELPLGKYTVREITAPSGYVLNTGEYNAILSYKDQNTAVTYTDISVSEYPQTGMLTITKQDLTTNTRAQGDATLKGAIFELYAAQDIKKLDGSYIYRKGELVDTLTCGDSVSVTSKDIPLGEYFIKEKVPPKGYTLDLFTHAVKIEYQGQNIAVVRKNIEVQNRVIQGQITIVKHTDLPDPNVTPNDPQIEQPVEGAVFNIYLKSVGSYDNALDSERDRIVTDANGYAKTKFLPYGVYAVEEVSAPGDVKLVEPFTVFISSDGRVYRYILNDPTFKSLVKIRKVDSATGETIPIAGISFKVWDVTGEKWITQKFNYPEITEISEFFTSEDGTLVMPEVLPSGDYLLYEQEAPWGYVLSKDPVPFTINSTQSNPAMAEVIMANAPQMGIIKVKKQGNMLTGVSTTNTPFGQQYNPIFSSTELPGAVFNIIAVEDIITPDGTLRAAKGTIVDTIITDNNGYAESIQLFLGCYEVIEVEATEGFVLDKTSHSVFLEYEGQEKAVISTQIGINNIRQTIDIDLKKVMENPIDAQKDFNPYNDVIFALYADQDIKAIDGTTVIPHGALIALMQIDNNGKGTISGELPFAKYYVKEVQTNSLYQMDTTKYPVVAEYIGQDFITTTIQVNEGLEIPNELKPVLIHGNIKIIKTEKDTGKPLAEATFGLYKDGELIAEGITNTDGIAEFLNIAYGEYEIMELSAPEGYKLTDRIFKAFIKNNGETISLEIDNEPIPIIDDTPKTGDINSFILFLILIVSSFGVIILIIRRTKKTK